MLFVSWLIRKCFHTSDLLFCVFGCFVFFVLNSETKLDDDDDNDDDDKDVAINVYNYSAK
jgi:hypothetical protein